MSIVNFEHVTRRSERDLNQTPCPFFQEFLVELLSVALLGLRSPCPTQRTTMVRTCVFTLW